MARLHSRKKGKSGSRKPSVKTPPSWISYSKEEVLSLVEKLGREGKSEAQIGSILRDAYGIPSVKLLIGKRISQVLEEKKLLGEYPLDLTDLIRKAVNLRKHVRENPSDALNKTKLVHIESKIKRLGKYYRGNKLPSDWKYDPEKVALLVK